MLWILRCGVQGGQLVSVVVREGMCMLFRCGIEGSIYEDVIYLGVISYKVRWSDRSDIGYNEGWYRSDTGHVYVGFG